MSRRVSAIVQVEMKVLVHVGNWEAKTNFEDLEQQALREARQSLGHHLRNTNIKVMGEPGVMTVTVKESN